MIDFLGTLVAKERGLSSQVAPRLPSRFETPREAANEYIPLTAPLDIAEPSPAAQPVRSVHAEHAAIAVPAVNGAARPGAVRVESQLPAKQARETEVASEPLQPRLLMAAPPDLEPRQLSAGLPALARVSEPVRAAPPRVARASPALPRPEPVQQTIRETLLIEPAALTSSAAPEGAPPSAASVVPTQAQPATRELPQPKAAAAIEHIARVASRREPLLSIAPVLPTPRLQRAAEATPPAEIHITIGRVEVRAATAPVPAKRTAAAARAMGLDEYLERRNRSRVR